MSEETDRLLKVARAKRDEFADEIRKLRTSVFALAGERDALKGRLDNALGTIGFLQQTLQPLKEQRDQLRKAMLNLQMVGRGIREPRFSDDAIERVRDKRCPSSWCSCHVDEMLGALSIQDLKDALTHTPRAIKS